MGTDDEEAERERILMMQMAEIERQNQLVEEANAARSVSFTQDGRSRVAAHVARYRFLISRMYFIRSSNSVRLFSCRVKFSGISETFDSMISSTSS